MILTCREVTRLVSQGMDRKLPFGRRVGLRVHFAICTGCTNFGKQMQFLRESLNKLADHQQES
jgi:Putative zinc-finger